MKKTLVLVAIVLALTGCTRKAAATKVLLDSGYTNIEITGYRVFGCSKDDEFHTGFKAVGPSGRSAEGIVCQGWFKGGTVRLD